MTLMPVSNISVVGVRFSTSGAARWMGQRSSTSIGSPWSMGSPSRLKIRPSVISAHGHRDRAAGVDDLGAARQAVGRVHRDRADAVVAEVLLHLAHEEMPAESPSSSPPGRFALDAIAC